MTLGFFLESLHLIEFAVLYLMIIAALKVYRRFTRTTNLLAALFACLYGLTDEVHQLFVDGRSFTGNDLIKDWIGVMTAYTIVRIKSKHLAAPHQAKIKNYKALYATVRMELRLQRGRDTGARSSKIRTHHTLSTRLRHDGKREHKS